MDCRHSEVSVPLYPRWGIFKVESINGVTTISLRHSAILSSTMETGGTERPGTNSNCVSSVPAPNHLSISQQQEPNSDSKEGCSFCQRREPNLEELLNFERELVMRGFHPTQQCPRQIPQQDVAFRETHYQVLQANPAKRANQILQPESGKKLKQDSSKSPDLRLSGSSGWCSVCQIDCKSKKAVEEHISGKKHRKMLEKLKEGETNENLEKNEKQVKEGDVPQKKRKRTSNSNEQTIKCNTCDKVFNTQDCFESHLAGKKHVKQLKIMEGSKVSSKVKDDSKKCDQPESNKKLKQDNSKSPDLGLPGSSGCCSVCQIDCKSKKALKEHILGKKHRNMSKKLKEGEINENLEENEKQVKEGDVPQKKRKRTSNTSELTIKCNTCDEVFITQDCFDSHLAGKQHVKQLKIMENSNVSSQVDDSKKCEDTDEIKLISTDSGFLVEDDAKKGAKLKHTGKAKDDSISTARSDKFDLKANTMLKDQEWKKKTDMSSNKHKISKKSSTFRKRECKTCKAKLYVEADFEAHFKGKRHAKMLKILEISKSSLERKGDGEECAKVDSKESGNSDFGLPTKDNAEIKEIDGVKVDVHDGGDNKLEVRNDKDVQRENAEIKWIVGVSDGEDQKLEVKVRNDNGVQRENSEIKEVEGENINVPDGEDNKLEVEVRDDKENIKSDFDGKKDNKMDIEVVAIETADDGPLVKDDVYKSAEDKIILEVKANGGLEVHGMKDGL